MNYSLEILTVIGMLVKGGFSSSIYPSLKDLTMFECSCTGKTITDWVLSRFEKLDVLHFEDIAISHDTTISGDQTVDEMIEKFNSFPAKTLLLNYYFPGSPSIWVPARDNFNTVC